MPSSNLGIVFVTTSQNQKELTINDAVEALDNAGNGSQAITITTHRTLTADEYVGSILFKLTGTPAADFNLVIPATKRLFAVRNSTGKNCTVKYAASGSLVVADGDSVIIHSDGTDIVSLGGGGGAGPPSVAFTDLTDTFASFAGKSLYKLRVNAGETAIEAVEDTGGGGGADYIARAGANRFVVLDTVNQSSEAVVGGDRVVAQLAPWGVFSNSAAMITGLGSGVNKISAYMEFLTAATQGGEIQPMNIKDWDFGTTLGHIEIYPDGSIGIARNNSWSSMATSATGVIVPGTFHKIAFSGDYSVSGGALRLAVDGVVVIDSTVTFTGSIGASNKIQIDLNNNELADQTTQYSRTAIWSTELDASQLAAVTASGDPANFEVSTLRAYWPFEDGTGITAVATVGGADLAEDYEGGVYLTWPTESFTTPAPTYTVVRISGSPTGDFAGHANELAMLDVSAWVFLGKVKGWQCYDQSDASTTVWSGSAWA